MPFAIKRTFTTIGHVTNCEREWTLDADQFGEVIVYPTEAAALARIEQAFEAWRHNGYTCQRNEIGVPHLAAVKIP